MMKFLTPRVARVATGVAVASAFVAAPMLAQADATVATGTLTAGALLVVAPVITPFNAALTGVTQSVPAQVGAWTLTNAVGNGAAYNVSVAAGAPSINGTSIAGSVGSTWLALTPTVSTPALGNPAPASTHPVPVAGPIAIGATAATIENAAVNTGSGQWNFAADAVGAPSLAITIPGNAAAGAYSDTLTYTIAAGVGT
jgi:hypothetical protein